MSRLLKRLSNAPETWYTFQSGDSIYHRAREDRARKDTAWLTSRLYGAKRKTLQQQYIFTRCGVHYKNLNAERPPSKPASSKRQEVDSAKVRQEDFYILKSTIIRRERQTLEKDEDVALLGTSTIL